MQAGFKKDYPSNVARSSSILTSGRVGRVPRFEYVNRQGQVVNPKNGKPYDRHYENGVHASSAKPSAKPVNKRYPIKTRGAMFGGLEPIPTDPTRDPPPRACYNCWQKGHSRRECPRPCTARYCNNCGRRGEDLTTCPRCVLAYDRYLNQIQARERGEELDPEEVARLLPESEFVEDEVEDEEDGCDEVLRELMLQDERARVVNNGRNRDYQERHIGLAVFQELGNASAYEGRERDRERERERERERVRDRDVLDKPYAERGKHERRSGYSDRETKYEDEIELQYQMERRERKEREEREERARERARWGVQESMSSAENAKQSTSSTTTSGAQITSDPVQDFLLLAKTIAHLSPETQDLIMRQVIAERKEHQARLKAIQHEREEDTWP